MDETDDLLCLWRADFDPEEQALIYGMDLFEREKKLWRRSREEHVEYAHQPEELERLLREAGFEAFAWNDHAIDNSEGRRFLRCVRNGR